MYSAGKFATEVSNIPQSLPISLFDLSPQLDLNAMRTFKLDPNSSFKEFGNRAFGETFTYRKIFIITIN